MEDETTLLSGDDAGETMLLAGDDAGETMLLADEAASETVLLSDEAADETALLSDEAETALLADEPERDGLDVPVEEATLVIDGAGAEDDDVSEEDAEVLDDNYERRMMLYGAVGAVVFVLAIAAGLGLSGLGGRLFHLFFEAPEIEAPPVVETDEQEAPATPTPVPSSTSTAPVNAGGNAADVSDVTPRASSDEGRATDDQVVLPEVEPVEEYEVQPEIEPTPEPEPEPEPTP
ncbi:MAG: hypothetical protein IJI88_04440, partial [Atopobiaceae bacterium]|nr:hypothetical protein [Atopobiaceae bacterium]